ncbi:MAG: toxin-antitoxin system protein [Bacteroidaceae bacterium]|nr:toxin-antitoxin system protein [Bacteroidaceae bacterium]
MESTVTQRRRISVELPIYAIDKLDQLAKEINVSRTSFLERYLLDSLYHEPNEETLAAMKEAKEGKYAGVVDLSSTEAMIKSILG